MLVKIFDSLLTPMHPGYCAHTPYNFHLHTTELCRSFCFIYGVSLPYTTLGTTMHSLKQPLHYTEAFTPCVSVVWWISQSTLLRSNRAIRNPRPVLKDCMEGENKFNPFKATCANYLILLKLEEKNPYPKNPYPP